MPSCHESVAGASKMPLAAMPLCAMSSCRCLFLLYVSSFVFITAVWSQEKTNATHNNNNNKDTNGTDNVTSTATAEQATSNGNNNASWAAVATTSDWENQQAGTTTTTGESQTQSWYNTAGWLPTRGIRPDRSVNLTVLPMLAILFFVFGVCIKCYSWMRDGDRTKARGQLDFEDDDDDNYNIIVAGERGYSEVDLRSDGTSIYDTVSSLRGLRPAFNNDNTVTSVTSVRSLPSHEALRQIILQANEAMEEGDGLGVYDSVHSYKAFLQRTMEMTEVDIEVELVDDYAAPRPRSKSFGAEVSASREMMKNRKQRRLRRHSGGRSNGAVSAAAAAASGDGGGGGAEGAAGVAAKPERERYRRHSDKSSAGPHHRPGDSFLSKTFQRRSSPAILEPLYQGEEFRIPLEQSGEEEEEEEAGSSSLLLHGSLDRQSSSSSGSSSAFVSSTHSLGGRERSHSKPRREKPRRKRTSQERSLERTTAVKGSSHSSGHCSDDSPKSSSSNKDSSSDLDSDSDVTDSGLVVDLPRSSSRTGGGAEKSCFKKGRDKLSSQTTASDGSIGNGGGGGASDTRKVARFKVSFVDDAALSAASD